MNRPTVLPSLPRLAHGRAFRLGAPSALMHADLLTSATALAPMFENIEISLFESEQCSALPQPSTLTHLQQLAAAHQLTYTVHLPMDRALGSPRRDERLAHQKQLIKIIALTKPLAPLAYILHLEGIEAQASAPAVKEWQRAIAELLPELIAACPEPAQLCIENLFYPFSWCDVFLERFALGACLDTGHLLLTGGEVRAHFRQYAAAVRVIHLHGIAEGRDHQSLTAMSPTWLRDFMNTIDIFKGVLTLELFDYQAMSLSLERLAQCLHPPCVA